MGSDGAGPEAAGRLRSPRISRPHPPLAFADCDEVLVGHTRKNSGEPCSINRYFPGNDLLKRVALNTAQVADLLASHDGDGLGEGGSLSP